MVSDWIVSSSWASNVLRKYAVIGVGATAGPMIVASSL